MHPLTLVCVAATWAFIGACPFQGSGHTECVWPASTPVSVADIRHQFEWACFRGPLQDKLSPINARVASRALDDEVRDRLHMDTTLCGPLADMSVSALTEAWQQRLRQQRALLYKSARATWNLFVALLQTPFPDNVAVSSQPDAWLTLAAARLSAANTPCPGVHFVPLANSTLFEVVPSPSWDSLGPLVPRRVLGNRVGFCVGDRLDLADTLTEVFTSRGVATLVEPGSYGCPYHVVLPVFAWS
jgi:hypothetical protein